MREGQHVRHRQFLGSYRFSRLVHQRERVEHYHLQLLPQMGRQHSCQSFMRHSGQLSQRAHWGQVIEGQHVFQRLRHFVARQTVPALHRRLRRGCLWHLLCSLLSAPPQVSLQCLTLLC